MKNNFNQNDLQLVTWQYQIKNYSTNYFKENDWVFIGSNPEYRMKVWYVSDTKVLAEDDYGNISSFYPACLQHYRFAGLKYAKSRLVDRINISLN